MPPIYPTNSTNSTLLTFHSLTISSYSHPFSLLPFFNTSFQSNKTDSLEKIRKVNTAVVKAIHAFNQDVSLESTTKLSSFLLRTCEKLKKIRKLDKEKKYAKQATSLIEQCKNLKVLLDSGETRTIVVENPASLFNTLSSMGYNLFNTIRPYFRIPEVYAEPLEQAKTVEQYIEQADSYIKQIRGFLSNPADIHQAPHLKQQALEQIKKAILLDPHNGEAFFIKGEIHYDFHENQEAYNCYSKALSLNYTSEQVYYRRGIIATDLGKRKIAHENLLKAISLNPHRYLEDSLYHYHLGQVEFSLGEFDRALRSFSKVLHFSKTGNLHKVRSLHSIAQILIHKQDFKGAKEHINEAIAISRQAGYNFPILEIHKSIIEMAIDERIPSTPSAKSSEKTHEVNKNVYTNINCIKLMKESLSIHSLKETDELNKILFRQIHEFLLLFSPQSNNYINVILLYFLENNFINSIQTLDEYIKQSEGYQPSQVSRQILNILELVEFYADSETELQAILEKRAEELAMSCSTGIENVMVGLLHFFSSHPEKSRPFFKAAAEKEACYSKLETFFSSLLQNDREKSYAILADLDIFHTLEKFPSYLSHDLGLLSVFSVAASMAFGSHQKSSEVMKLTYTVISSYLKDSGIKFLDDQAIHSNGLMDLMQWQTVAAAIGAGFVLWKLSSKIRSAPRQRRLPPATQTPVVTIPAERTPVKKQPIQSAEEIKEAEKVKETLKTISDSLKTLFDQKTTIGLNLLGVDRCNDAFTARLECTAAKYWPVLKSDDIRSQYMEIVSHLLGSLEAKTIDDPHNGLKWWLIKFKELPQEFKSVDEEYFKKMKALDDQVKSKIK